VRQLLVQKNTSFDTKIPLATKMVQKDTPFDTKPHHATRNGARKYPI